MASRTAANHEDMRDTGKSTTATALTGLLACISPEIAAGTGGGDCGAARSAGPGRTIGPGPSASEGRWAG